MPHIISKFPSQIRGGAVMVWVRGERNGKEMEYKFSGTARMREATAVPLAIGGEMIGRGEIKGEGIMPPEACIPPSTFLNRLLKKNVLKHAWMEERREIEEI